MTVPPCILSFATIYLSHSMSQTFSEVNFNAKPKGYAVFVWSMKPDRCDFDLLILVRRTSTCIEAQSLNMSARKRRLSKWGKKMNLSL